MTTKKGRSTRRVGRVLREETTVKIWNGVFGGMGKNPKYRRRNTKSHRRCGGVFFRREFGEFCRFGKPTSWCEKFIAKNSATALLSGFSQNICSPKTPQTF